MLNNKINRDTVIPGARDHQISIANSRINKISERILDKLVILSQDTNNSSSSFDCISFYSAAESDIIITIDEYFVGHHISDPFVVESHKTFEKDDIGWLDVCWFGKSGMLHKRVLRDCYRLVRVFKFSQNIVSQVKIQGQRMVKIILSYVDLILINAYRYGKHLLL